MTTKADKLAIVSEAAGSDRPDQLALLKGLTDQQQLIARLRLRGLPQNSIAKILDITPARVSQEAKVIREHYLAKGAAMDQAALVGESLSLFEEVERKAWEVFHDDEGKRLRALDTVMVAREKQIKLLMDLGIIRRAPTEHSHQLTGSPLMQSLSREKREAIVAGIIATSPGIEPEPPMESDDEFIEAVFTTDESEVDSEVDSDDEDDDLT